MSSASYRTRATLLRIASGIAALGLCLLPDPAGIQAARRLPPQGVFQQIDAAKPGPARVPVLVELFTSEGCSSCPPADALLARLDREQPVPNADIIVLSEHVDYWDNLGWKDRFSSPEFTARQTEYRSYFELGDIYTPQSIVNGSEQFNGADAAGIEKAVQKAATSRVVLLHFSEVKVHGDVVTFSLQGGEPATPGYVNVYAVLIDPTDTTEVRGGENHGRTLHHAGVVRSFGQVGSSWRIGALGERPFTFQTHGLEKTDGMRLVVFVQTTHIGPVLGTVACSLGSVSGTPASGSTSVQANPCPRPAHGT